MNSNVLAKGAGGVERVVEGRVATWSNELIRDPSAIPQKIICFKGDVKLYQAAFLVENGAKGVIMSSGGKNYHPHILLSDAEIPSVSGVGVIGEIDGVHVVLDSGQGEVRRGPIELKDATPQEKPPVTCSGEVYVNVWHSSSMPIAAGRGADGIGLLRTEFVFASALSKLLSEKLSTGETVGDSIAKTSEADVIYHLATDSVLSKELKQRLSQTLLDAIDSFPNKDILVRTLDAPSRPNDPMGNRGIRRCLAEGGHSIRLIAEAIGDVLRRSSKEARIGVILPLVSHYSQISGALSHLQNAGLKIGAGGGDGKQQVLFGWEIEQPAAALKNQLWLTAFRADYGKYPDFIGIGTNDLTQFTIALGRDVAAQEQDKDKRESLQRLYDEADISVVRQIYEVSRHKCEGTKILLLGQASGRPEFGPLMLSFGVIPSVSVSKLNDVRRMVAWFEREADPRLSVRSYIGTIASKFSAQAKPAIEAELEKLFLDILG